MSTTSHDSQQNRILAPGPRDRTARSERGDVIPVPDGWELLPPGDAGLTRRVKAAGPTWTIQKKVGRRTFSCGIWASGKTIASSRAAIEAERSTDAYRKRQTYASQRRDKTQSDYVTTFRQSVLDFLAFAPCHEPIAMRLADAVTTHATPVGSGTVARTKRIAVEDRAEAAVIAWMRHQTTAYERMTIPRIKGHRREVRRMLAQRSHQLLMRYRSGEAVDASKCPLQKALR